MDQLLDVETIKKLTPDQQTKVLTSIKQEAAIASAQGIIAAISKKCTRKCFQVPGTSLSGAEKQCLQRCMDRFIDNWNLVSITLQKRLKDESNNLRSSFNQTPSTIFDNSIEGPTFS